MIFDARSLGCVFLKVHHRDNDGKEHLSWSGSRATRRRFRAASVWCRLFEEPFRVLDALTGIKSGDVILPLVDGRELRLERVSRPDPHQAEILARLGIEIPERIGTDTVHMPGVVQT